MNKELKLEKLIQTYKDLMEFKKADDNQEEPFYSTSTPCKEESEEKKCKKCNKVDCECSEDECECPDNSEDSVNEISQYDLVVTFLRSKGLDPYKISPQQRSLWKSSPAFNAWKRINRYESYNGTNEECNISKPASIVKSIYKKKIVEDLVDVDKLNKKDSGFGKVTVEKGFDFSSKAKEKGETGCDAELVMTRDKTLTGSKNCNRIEINPKLNIARPHQYVDKDRDR